MGLKAGAGASYPWGLHCHVDSVHKWRAREARLICTR